MTLVLMAILALQAVDGASTQGGDQWWSVLKTDGWTFVRANPQQAIFMRSGPAGHGTATVWQRIEYAFSPIVNRQGRAGEYLSRDILFEVDCRADKLRTLQEDVYSNNNLTGTPVQSMLRVPTAWEYAAPNSEAEQTLRFVCHAQSAKRRR